MGLTGGKNTKIYAKPITAVSAAVEQALPALKMTITEKGDGFIKAKTGLGLLSLGSNITINITPGKKEETIVTITAAPKGITMIDYGRGDTEIRNIFEKVTELIGTSPLGEQCPACGRAVTPEDKFCEGCGAQLGTGGKKCPRCAAAVNSEDKFCEKCGAQIK